MQPNQGKDTVFGFLHFDLAVYNKAKGFETFFYLIIVPSLGISSYQE